MKSTLNLVGWRPEGPTKRVCWKCAANTLDLPFTDPSLTAAWRRTCISDRGYIIGSSITGTEVSSLFAVPGFRLSFVSIDWMHVVDLGIAQYCLGNVLWELFQELGGVACRPAQTVGCLLTMIRTASRQVGMSTPPVNALTLSMFKVDSKPPKLKTKAAETRKLVSVLRFMLEHFFPRSSEHDVMRFNCVELLARAYSEMELWSSESRTRIGQLGRQHVTLYAELAREQLSRAAGEWVMWRLYPKHHLFAHLLESQICTYDSPRASWCYADEGEIGKCVAIAEAVHVKTLNKALLEKYRLW